MYGPVEIDKLALEMPGLSAEEGRRLAEMVAEGLGGVEWPRSAPDSIDAEIVAEPGSTGLEQMARMIVAEIRRQLG